MLRGGAVAELAVGVISPALHRAGGGQRAAVKPARADRDRLSTELKREFGRLVAATTSQVTGKILNADDQKRISEDALAKVEA